METVKLTHHPPSPRQVDANRANASKSTGPVTEAGKRNVSNAALKHGLYCSRLVIATLGEKQEDYDALLQSHLDAWQPVDGQQASLVELITASTWLQRRAINSQAQVVEREVVKVDKDCRAQHLAEQRVNLDETDPDIQQWGVRRLPDRPAKFLYWRHVLSMVVGLAEAGAFGPEFQRRWRLIYGQYPSAREESILGNAEALSQPRQPGQPAPARDPRLVAEVLAELKKDQEEVEREYELYQQREAQLRAATRGACGVPEDSQFVLAQRVIEAMGRAIRQGIEELIKVKRMKVELEGSGPVGPSNDSTAGPAPGLDPTGPETEALPESLDPGPGTGQEGEPAVPEASAEPNKDESHHMLENTGPASSDDQ